MDEVQITIIGGGVIGLAIAARLSAHYDNIVVLPEAKNTHLKAHNPLKPSAVIIKHQKEKEH